MASPELHQQMWDAANRAILYEATFFDHAIKTFSWHVPTVKCSRHSPTLFPMVAAGYRKLESRSMVESYLAGRRES